MNNQIFAGITGSASQITHGLSEYGDGSMAKGIDALWWNGYDQGIEDTFDSAKKDGFITGAICTAGTIIALAVVHFIASKKQRIIKKVKLVEDATRKGYEHGKRVAMMENDFLKKYEFKDNCTDENETSANN